MISAFVSALILEIFATSFVVLVVAYDRRTEIENFSDFIVWNIFLIIPSIIAIYIGSGVTEKGNQFAVLVGKYANQCDDEISHRKVRL
jgi:hypothetical protein